MARAMSMENYGYYVLAFSTLTVLSVPVSLGLPNLIVRYISKYEVEKKYGEMKGLLVRAHQIVFIVFIIIVAIALLTYNVWWSRYNIELIRSMWVGFIFLLFLALGSIRAAALRGLKFVILGQLPDTFLRNLLFCIGIAVYFFGKITLTPEVAMIIQVISAIISYIVGYIFLYKKLLSKLKGVSANYHNRLWLKEAIPFSINGGIQIVKSKLITYVLAGFGSVEAVAIYDIALRGASLVSFGLDALNTAIAPYISSAFEQNNKKQLQRIVTKSSRIIFLGAVPITLIFILGGKSLLGFIFSKNYAIAYVPLVIICLGQLVSSICGSVGLVLSMTGNQGYFTRNNVYITLLNVLICIPFVIWWGVIGASIVYGLLLVIQNLVLYVYVKEKLNINTTVF